MKTQLEMWRDAERRSAEVNQTFMNLVNHATNPLTREDLARNIERRPGLWGRFSGFLSVLPSGTLPDENRS